MWDRALALCACPPWEPTLVTGTRIATVTCASER